MPIGGRGGDTLAMLPPFREMLKAAGRPESEVPVTLFGISTIGEGLKRARDAGVERVVFGVPPEARDKVLPLLDKGAALMTTHDRRPPRPRLRALDRRCGHPTRDVHNRYLQRMITRTAASTFRARDRARADTRALYRADDAGWSGLTDVDFRVGRFGQLEFTHAGEDHVIQYMPVGMQEMAAPPELMLAQMMYAGSITACCRRAAPTGR